MPFKISRIQRLSAVTGISMTFFIAEISVGFYTGSLALIADAFHYLSDVVGFIVALVAAIVEKRHSPPPSFTFGWQRSQLLGAFFNGVLLFSLGISTFLQSIERFIRLEIVEDPRLVMIVGCIGFGLNIISVVFLHEHDHGDRHDTYNDETSDIEEAVIPHKQPKPKPKFDLALMAVLVHIMGDCANNLGIIIAGFIIWQTDYSGRYYADPAVGMAIAVMIFLSSLPFSWSWILYIWYWFQMLIYQVKRGGRILLQSAPDGVEPENVKRDLLQIPGITAVDKLHIWQLNQEKAIASAHLVLQDNGEADFYRLVKTANECFYAYGIHHVTVQPVAVDANKEAFSVASVESGKHGRMEMTQVRST